MMVVENNNQIRNFILGVLFDAIGMSSLLLPGLGDVIDLVWGPLAAWLMTQMYKGRVGKAAGVLTFIEEILPGLDVIPTFTIMWVYTYFLSRKNLVEG